jgi:REP element-mobilizing transposase RayT
MAVRRAISHKDGLYFITITCARWIHLIEITNGCDIVYNWFDYLKSKGHHINGYVIMPNHLHALIAFRNTGKSINTIIGNGKRFMAYELVERLKKLGATELLTELQSFVNSTDHKRNKKHEVFEPSFDWKECYSKSFIEQKLNYMHANPCQGNWSLVESPELYAHSSAKYYLTGIPGIYEVMRYTELADIDLTK